MQGLLLLRKNNLIKRGLSTTTLELNSLTAISAVDGRYQDKTAELRHHFSEYALIKQRVKVEIEWLKYIKDNLNIIDSNKDVKNLLDDIYENFNINDANRVKEIEKTTNHDVKAVEYFLKEKSESNTDLNEIKEFFHFACTSEDINNLSQSLMLKNALHETILPEMKQIIDLLNDRADLYASVPMLSRTHGQPATPSTVGKELKNFSFRLNKQYENLKRIEIYGKFNGAVGNFAAHVVSIPIKENQSWPEISKDFIENSLELVYNPYTTQIEPHDYVAEICNTTAHFNTILIDLNRDMWNYISLGYFKQKVIAGEIGSSTMPHKVNPIDFENSEGNLGLSNALLKHMSEKLPISRYQRDLSDSTVLRSTGSCFAYGLIAYKSLVKGLNKVEVNEEKLNLELNNNWEVLAEPVQTIMRRLGRDAPYEQLKELTRGKKVSEKEMREFVTNLKLPAEEEEILMNLTPQNYIGVSEFLAKDKF